MADLQEGLLVGRGKRQAKEYKRRVEEVEVKLRTLRNKNNELQKQCAGDLESDIRRAIRSQRQYLEKEISETKALLAQLTEDFTDPTAKNKIKELCKLAGTEIERNRRIMQEFVNRASTNPSMLRRSTLGKKRQDSRYGSEYSSHSHNEKVAEQRQEEEEEDMSDQLLLEERIAAERQAILKEIEEKNRIINALYNDMAEMVGGEQREMVNQIDNNVTVARDNVVKANAELDEAIVEQKKSKKKYICIVTTIVILILAAVGLLLFIL